MTGAEDDGFIPTELPITAMKEQFSLGFVRMLAAAAGFSIKTHETDYDGVDITISASGEYELYYCPEVEFQIKCTSQHSKLSDSHLTYEIDAKPFVRLTKPNRYHPAYLGVLLVPVEADNWLDLDEKRLRSESRMYWESARKLGSLQNGAKSKTVRLSRMNILTPDRLRDIMQAAGDGVDL